LERTTNWRQQIAPTAGAEKEYRMNGPGQMRRRAIRAVAAGAALLLRPLAPAYPASIERRPDGTLLAKAQESAQPDSPPFSN